MNVNDVIQLIWIDLSRPKVNSSKKAILEYRPNFKKVSVLPNLEWGNYPLGIGSYVSFVKCEKPCMRGDKYVLGLICANYIGLKS